MRIGYHIPTIAVAVGLILSAIVMAGPHVLEQESVATEHHVAPGQVWRVELPEFSADGSRLLKLTVRLESPKMGGYGTYMTLVFNGRPLDAARTRYSIRLMNKPLSFRRETGQKVYWNHGDGLWETIFAPSFNTDFKRMGPDVAEPYTYLIDVSDLAHSGKSNVVEIANTYPITPPRDLVVTMDWLAAKHSKHEARRAPRPTLAMMPKLSVGEDGTFALATSDKSIEVESSFSIPGGGVNRFGSVSKEAAWRPQVTQVDAHRWLVESADQFYSLRREILQTAGRIAVQDTFKNLTARDIGIIFDNYLNLADHPQLDYCRIGGLLGQGVNNVNSRANPTLFFPLNRSSLTMVAEDDVLRNQATFYFDTKELRSGIRDGMFALAPNASYTVKWSIYIRPSDDYFDMINQLRQDWGANITIPGPVHFVNYRPFARMSRQGIVDAIRKSGARYFAFWQVDTPSDKPAAQWDNKQIVAMGSGVFDPIFTHELQLVKKAVANLHAAGSEVKVALYSEPFFVCPEKPDDMTFKDSWVTTSDGKRAISQYNNNKFYNYRTVYPTLHNSYGKAYMRMIDFYLDDLNLDWLYIDESNGPGVTIQAGDNLEGYLTYNAWDGHSAKIDPKTGMITQKCGFLTLLSDDFLKTVVEKVRRKGGFVLFNGPGTTRSRQDSPSMSETQWDITRGYRTHLGTPLAFAPLAYSSNMLDVRQRLDRGMLLFRSPWITTATPVRHFFPFTPIALHDGWMVGHERIITDKSGSFGWPDGPFAGKLYVYDGKGELALTQTIGVRSTPLTIDVPDGGVAILERQPTKNPQ